MYIMTDVVCYIYCYIVVRLKRYFSVLGKFQQSFLHVHVHVMVHDKKIIHSVKFTGKAFKFLADPRGRTQFICSGIYDNKEEGQ